MAIGLRAAKQQLRQQLREALKGMTSQQRQEESLILVEKLFQSPHYQQATRISVYLNMPHEVDTSHILEDIFASGKEKLCYVPRFHGDNMDMLRVHSLEDIQSLPAYKWGIKQPAIDDPRENALASGGLDLIIMPGLGFTEDGKRLGQGKGYYDSFLRQCYEAGYTPITIALAFSLQKCQDIPTGPTDVNIDHVIFP